MSLVASLRWGVNRPDQRPFTGRDCAFVITPIADGPDAAAIATFITLLEREQAELSTELGCPVTFTSPSTDTPRPALCLIGPAPRNPMLGEVQRTIGAPDPGEAHV